MRPILMALVFATIPACGGDDGGGGGSADANDTVDSKVFMDAAASMITVSGQATSRGLSGTTPEANVLVAAYRNSDENTPVAMTMTDTSGNYSLTIQTNGVALDGYLKATKSGYKETYLYPPAPLGVDFNMASIIMVTPGTYGTIYTLTGVSEEADKALVAVLVTDGNNPVGGATVSSTPAATYKYNDPSSGFPSGTATSTHTDGIGYMLNTPPGQVTVSATKTGLTLKSHGLKAWQDQLTTTLIVP